ncbi:MAG: copper-binding protein, partial [Candidatus Binatia bacterium]|nr:copper-binding protein [Candidatus Binatia bacterium]
MSPWMGYIDDLVRREIAIFLVLTLGGLACQPPPPPQRISGRGVVQQVVRADQRLVVAHEELPGLMRARTSGFTVRDPTLLERVTPGERIRFTLEKTEQTLYLVAVEKE